MGKAHRSVGASKTCPVCFSFTLSCCKTPRAAWTAARASTVALKLSRKAAASRYSRLASASNSRINATRRVSTRRVRSRATPRSSDLRIGHDSQYGIEIGRIIIFRFHLQVVHLNVVRRLFDGHQQRKDLGKRNTLESKVDGGFLITLNNSRRLWLHACDPIANLCRRGRFFHEGQQGKLSRRDGHTLFELGNTSLLGHILLCDEHELLAVFRLA